MSNIGGTWNLYDMLRISGDNFFHVSQSLRHLRLGCSLFESSIDKPLTDGDQELIRVFMPILADLCKEMGLFGTQKYITRKANDLLADKSANNRILDEVLKEVEHQIKEQLTACIVLVINERDAALYSDHEKWFDITLKKFPSISTDLAEMYKCLALERGTAAVAHAMRVLEVGLRAVAKTLEIPFARTIDSSWGPIIDEIESKLRDLEKASNKTSQMKKRLQKLSEGAVQFRHFKNAWRNNVFHTKSFYAPETARDIVYNVSTFMQHLAGEKNKKNP